MPEPTSPEDEPPGHPVPPRRRWWRWLLLGAGIALAVLELRGHLPDPATTWRALRRASPAWLLVAAGLEVLSMATFAEQQRRLLASFGVRMRAGVALAVSYARAAMAFGLPAGSAVSAGYAFRQYRSCGASQPVAAAVMLLSAVASVAGVAVVYTADVLAWTRPSAVALAVGGAAVALLAFGVYRLRTALAARPPAAPAPAPVTAPGRGRVRRVVREAVTVARTVPPGDWLRVLLLAGVNWLTDLGCLLAAVHAVGLTVPARVVAAAYLAAQLLRQIPATPGGIGVIEASLLLALTTAGAGTAPAAAAVLLYRLLSCWAILPIGLICWSVRKPAVTTRTLALAGAPPA